MWLTRHWLWSCVISVIRIYPKQMRHVLYLLGLVLLSSSAFDVMVALTRSSLPWVPHTWMSGTNPLQTPRAWCWGTRKWAISAALLVGGLSRTVGSVLVFGPPLHRDIYANPLEMAFHLQWPVLRRKMVVCWCRGSWWSASWFGLYPPVLQWKMAFFLLRRRVSLGLVTCDCFDSGITRMRMSPACPDSSKQMRQNSGKARWLCRCGFKQMNERARIAQLVVCWARCPSWCSFVGSILLWGEFFR